MYRPSSKLSYRPPIQLPPSPFHLELALTDRSAGVALAHHPLPLRNLDTVEKRGRRGGTNVFPCLFIERSETTLSRRVREFSSRIIQLGIKRISERTGIRWRTRDTSVPVLAGEKKGREEEGKIKEEGSGREFCRRLEKLPTIPRSRGVERN